PWLLRHRCSGRDLALDCFDECNAPMGTAPRYKMCHLSIRRRLESPHTPDSSVCLTNQGRTQEWDHRCTSKQLPKRTAPSAVDDEARRNCFDPVSLPTCRMPSSVGVRA